MSEVERVRSYKDLDVWKVSLELTVSCYELTKSFPKEEQFGLTSQIRRAAAAVPANLAEGHGRETTGSYIQFARIAQGSLKELETHLIIAERVGIASVPRSSGVLAECDRVGRMLRNLIRALQAKS